MNIRNVLMASGLVLLVGLMVTFIVQIGNHRTVGISSTPPEITAAQRVTARPESLSTDPSAPFQVMTIQQLLTYVPNNQNFAPVEVHGQILAIRPYKSYSSNGPGPSDVGELEIGDSGSIALVPVLRAYEPAIYSSLKVGDQIAVRGLYSSLHCSENHSPDSDCNLFHIVQDPVPWISVLNPNISILHGRNSIELVR
jgi:hypothetical protein